MYLMLLGAPGVGKGTQAERIMARYDIPQISTGEILRAEIQAESALGLQVKSVLDAGELVSDELILRIVANRISQADCAHGFILDGFPRTIPQAEGLRNLLRRMGNIELNVFEIYVPEEEIMRRLLARKRADDTRETIENRLEVYHRSTAPLISFYQKDSHYTRIDGSHSIEDVATDIDGHLKALTLPVNVVA